MASGLTRNGCCSLTRLGQEEAPSSGEVLSLPGGSPDLSLAPPHGCVSRFLRWEGPFTHTHTLPQKFTEEVPGNLGEIKRKEEGNEEKCTKQR